MFDCTVTISEAAAYSSIPVRKWFEWVKAGLVVASPGPPGDMNSTERTHYAAICRIPLSALPRHAEQQFIQQHFCTSGPKLSIQPAANSKFSHNIRICFQPLYQLFIHNITSSFRLTFSGHDPIIIHMKRNRYLMQQLI